MVTLSMALIHHQFPLNKQFKEKVKMLLVAVFIHIHIISNRCIVDVASLNLVLAARNILLHHSQTSNYGIG